MVVRFGAESPPPPPPRWGRWAGGGGGRVVCAWGGVDLLRMKFPVPPMSSRSEPCRSRPNESRDGSSIASNLSSGSLCRKLHVGPCRHPTPAQQGVSMAAAGRAPAAKRGATLAACSTWRAAETHVVAAPLREHVADAGLRDGVAVRPPHIRRDRAPRLRHRCVPPAVIPAGALHALILTVPDVVVAHGLFHTALGELCNLGRQGVGVGRKK